MRWGKRAFAALAATALLTLGFASSAQAASRTIVYIGANDCSVCHKWEAAHKRALQASCAARGVRFREIQVATIRNIRDARYWPADLRPLLAQFSDRSGTPHFLAVRNGEVVINAWGIGKYQREIAPLVASR